MTEIEKRTPLGYRDITEKIHEIDFWIEKYDVIRGVIPVQSEKQVITYENGHELIYKFYEPEKNLAGRIFPYDEIIINNIPCDIIAQNFRKLNKEYKRNIDSNPYHDFFENEKFGIMVSQITQRGDPAFKLYNRITGFIKERKYWKEPINVGTKLLVEVIAHKIINSKEIVLVRPVESLNDLEE